MRRSVSSAKLLVVVVVVLVLFESPFARSQEDAVDSEKVEISAPPSADADLAEHLAAAANVGCQLVPVPPESGTATAKTATGGTETGVLLTCATSAKQRALPALTVADVGGDIRQTRHIGVSPGRSPPPPLPQTGRRPTALHAFRADATVRPGPLASAWPLLADGTASVLQCVAGPCDQLVGRIAAVHCDLATRGDRYCAAFDAAGATLRGVYLYDLGLECLNADDSEPSGGTAAAAADDDEAAAAASTNHNGCILFFGVSDVWMPRQFIRRQRHDAPVLYSSQSTPSPPSATSAPFPTAADDDVRAKLVRGKPPPSGWAIAATTIVYFAFAAFVGVVGVFAVRKLWADAAGATDVAPRRNRTAPVPVPGVARSASATTTPAEDAKTRPSSTSTSSSPPASSSSSLADFDAFVFAEDGAAQQRQRAAAEESFKRHHEMATAAAKSLDDARRRSARGGAR